MGNEAEKYFDINECKCGSKKFKAMVSKTIVFYKDNEDYWEDETDYDENVKVVCDKCGEEV